MNFGNYICNTIFTRKITWIKKITGAKTGFQKIVRIDKKVNRHKGISNVDSHEG